MYLHFTHTHTTGAHTEHIHDTMLRLRSIAEEAGADKDIVQRTHSLALENARRREDLQVKSNHKYAGFQGLFYFRYRVLLFHV